MGGSDEKASDDVRQRSESHGEFLELCALSTSGSLTPDEREKLSEHLKGCPDCREAIKEFEAVVDEGVAPLASDLGKEPTGGNPPFSVAEAEARFFKRLSDTERFKPLPGQDTEPWPLPLAIRKSRDFRLSLDRYHLWLPAAAAFLLFATMGILAYRMGVLRGVAVARRETGNTETRSARLAPDTATQGNAKNELDAMHVQLAERYRDISDLQRRVDAQLLEIARLKSLQTGREVAAQDAEGLVVERDDLTKQLAAAQEALKSSEEKRDRLEQERAEAITRTAKLEIEVAGLSRAMQDEERTTDQQRELLAHDRDIRELMGARDLYVAEVYDVERTGETQKAFGRIFYTKGKSLIFYAYDLDEAPGWKDVTTFQAWGTHGTDRAQAFNLGMFYEDNVTKKRWVLKSSDANALKQIDAVFVTVEPHGGSNKPSGKPLLFAYLKMNANHP